MSNRLTMKMLKESIDGLQQEVKGLRVDVGRVENTMNTNFAEMDKKFSGLQSSVDKYFHKTESWYQEHVILKARHDRLSNSLIQKGVVTKEETLL